MYGKIILFILLAVLIQYLIRLWTFLGYYKDVKYHHTPGPCRTLYEEDGSEDLSVLKNGLAFITSGYYLEKGKVKLFDFNDPRHGVEDLPILGIDAVPNFMAHPHGLSIWEHPETGVLYLYVLTHPPDQDRVEVFEFDQTKRELKYIKSITDPLFRSMNDLVLVDIDKFYITQIQWFKNTYLAYMEYFLLVKHGEVLFFDGMKARSVASSLHLPNGINSSPDKSLVYVAEFGSQQITVFKRNKDDSLDGIQTVPVDCGVDNIEVDPSSEDLWVGGHPSPGKAIEYNANAGKNRTAPSQVFRMKTSKGLITDVIEIYRNNGTEISASTVATYFKRRILIGSIGSKLLLCDAKYIN
ncbi:hypothetical protein CHS0354_021542 [Potamilus streckersoni]|uniref:Paraoxonase n=1 Tax=Potamilus streckersoni TaxID=2493646 RepID=A0AAE0SNR0_9BIVA|nr:hypothetical protein CHS0354_021542 [Potamilus streckersoni]